MPSLRSLLAATLCAASAFALPSAQAAPVVISSNGVFDAGAAATLLTAPNAAWAMTFTMDAEPVRFVDPALTFTGLFFTAPFSNFSYTLDGVPIANQPTYISLYNAGNGGGIDVYFNDILDGNSQTTALSFYAPQIYTGDESDPTLSPGIYTTTTQGHDGLLVYVEDVLTQHGDPLVTVALVPAPATLLLALSGVLALALHSRRTRSYPRATSTA